MKELHPDFICDYEVGKAEINIRGVEEPIEVYFTELRVPNFEVPEGFFKYEVRGSDKDGSWATLENIRVCVNFVATILSDKEIPLTTIFTSPEGETDVWSDILSYTADFSFYEED